VRPPGSSTRPPAADYKPVPRLRSLPLLALTAALAVWPATAGAVPTITEYSSGLSINSGPTDIVTGPDGNLWFTEKSLSGGIGRMTPDGQITEFLGGVTPGFTAGSQPTGITAAEDGNLWFTEAGGLGAIGRITPDGVVTEFTSGLTTGSAPTGITAGPDGNLWFTEEAAGRIGRIAPDGTIGEFGSGLSGSSEPHDIVAGPDGNLWFTEKADPGRIGRITTDGEITEFSAGLTPDSRPLDISVGPDGNLWFTEANNPGRIGRITTEGEITEFSAGLTPDLQPSGITEGGDGQLWFTQAGSAGGIGRLTAGGGITEFAGGVALSLTAASAPLGITQGPDGNVWFTENANPGRIGLITVPPGVEAKPAASIQSGDAMLKAKVRPNTQDTSFYFEYGTTEGYGQTTEPASAGADAGFGVVHAQVAGLPPDTHYHFRVVATNPSGTTIGEDVTFTTKAAVTATTPATETASPADPPLEPTLGETVVLRPLRGAVRVRRAGTSHYTELAAGEQLPVGSLVDARHGTVELSSALDAAGRIQRGEFWGAIFQVRQARRGRGVTDLALRGGSFAACRSTRARGSALAIASARRRSVRRLWGRDTHARFRTHGRDSVATVRGTQWLTEDRCDGTLTRVRSGKVLVRDLRRKRSVLLRAGRAYLARHRR